MKQHKIIPLRALNASTRCLNGEIRNALDLGRRTPVRAFFEDEEGGLIIFGLFMFVLMLLACGMGLDLMRLETARVQLQSTVDRAALAAASLNQELPPADVVADYFEKAHLSNYLGAVEVTEEPGLRNVQVDTTLNMPMHFMNLAGINTLPAPAFGAAEESIGDVEISMVLDVSGSMSRYNRLVNLKLAAEDFVDVVYSASTSGVVSTSLVPYATQVNAGETLLSKYNLGAETHSDSHCVNFEQNVFSSTGLTTAQELEQTQHFDPWYYDDELQLPVCRANPGVEILAWSRDPVEIKDRVNAFVAGGNTSTDVGVKWGNALLDPGSQGVLSDLVTSGDVDPLLQGRPYAYGVGDSMKVMVVMSDGVHTQQYYMKDEYRGDALTDTWMDDTSGTARYSIWSGNGAEPVAANDWQVPGNEFYWPHDGSWNNQPYGAADAERLSWQQVWARITVRYHADEHIQPAKGWAARNDILNSYSYVAPSDKNDRLISACQAAKDEDVVVFTVGLEVTQASGDLLKACATSPNHYFLVSGEDIGYAFRSIAGQINRLRLTH